jgi:phytanoyl-CoA hydroxylase
MAVAAVSSAAAMYQRDGFYLARSVFDERALRELEEDFDRMVEQLRRSGEDVNARWQGAHVDRLDGGESTVIHTHNVHRYSGRWLRAFLDRRFLACAKAILGPNVVLHHSKLFQKPPRQGAAFPMHQDWWYFPTQHDSMLAATIFLTDADENVGGFCVYPGSHKLGRMGDSSGLGGSANLDQYPLSGATPVNARRGDVLFFSYFTLHGSPPNRSDRVRKTVLVQLHSGDDFVVDNPQVNHCNEHLVLCGWNQHMTRTRAVK